MAAGVCRPAIIWFLSTTSTGPAGDRNAAGQVLVPAVPRVLQGQVGRPTDDPEGSSLSQKLLPSLVGAEMIIINEIRD